MVPVLRTQDGGEPLTIDLAAYYSGLERVVSAACDDTGTSPAVAVEVTSSPLDGRLTAVCIRPSEGPTRRVFTRAGLVFTNGEAGEALLVIDHIRLPRIEFTYHHDPGSGAAPAASQVFVAGSFNGWNAHAHRLQGPDAEGVCRLRLPWAEGKIRYKFIIDGNWFPDPVNPVREPDGMGGFNSVLDPPAPVETQWDLFPSLSPTPSGVSSYALVPRRNVAAAAGDRFTSEPVRIEYAMVMAGNRIVSDDDERLFTLTSRLEPEKVQVLAGIEGEVMLGGLHPADIAGPDGLVRVMVRFSGGAWADCVIQRSPAAWMGPEWRGRSIYFALTDRFADGDSTNNKPVADPPGEKLHPLVNYHGGDWAGLRGKIEQGYFDALGVGALWISAVNRQTEKAEQESVAPGHRYTAYHGYWPVSATEVNPHFGTLEELRELVATAHKHDILVLLDLVSNHVHQAHPWFLRHPDWFGALKLPDGRDNIRLFDEHPFSTWFDAFLPGFDYEKSPAATDAVTDNAVWWVEQTGIDGFRQDAVKHIEPVFWRALTRRLRDRIEVPRGRRLYQVGETIADPATIMRFVSAEMLDGQFDFPLYWPLRAALGAETAPMSDLAAAIDESARRYDAGTLMSPLIGNHDVSRFMAFADGDLRPDSGQDEKALGWQGAMRVDHPAASRRLLLAQTLLHALPGCPMLYYGDEIGLTGAADPDNRRPMLFDDALTTAQHQLLEQVRRLGMLRRGSPALRYGACQPLWSDAEGLAFARVSTGRDNATLMTEPNGTADSRAGDVHQAVIVVLNRTPAARTIRFALPRNLSRARTAVVLYAAPGDPAADSPDAVTVVDHNLSIPISAMSAQIIELKS